MRIKIDEDIPPVAARWLEERGYESNTVIDQGMGGWKDPDLWEVVQAEERFLITADKGFADIRVHPPGTHAGILLLRPDEDGIRPILELLQLVLNQTQLARLEGTVSVATPRGMRIRRS